MRNELHATVAREGDPPRRTAEPRLAHRNRAPGRYWLAVWTLAEREIVRFFRQRTRVIGALGQPVMFWILFGAGLHGSFAAPEWAPAGMSYQEYFFPGVAVMIVLFTAIFSTISIIEDRREGFLQGVLVAPVPRLAIVSGKLVGGAVIAVLQAVLFLAIGPLLTWLGLGPTMSLDYTFLGAIETLAFLTLLAFALTALGYCIAWPLDSTQGFHAIMSVFLLPMWLLSGSLFPGTDTPWLAWIIRLNPLTYGVAGLRRLMYSRSNLPVGEGLPSLGLSVAVTVGFTIVCVAVAVAMTTRRTASNVA